MAAPNTAIAALRYSGSQADLSNQLTGIRQVLGVRPSLEVMAAQSKPANDRLPAGIVDLATKAGCNYLVLAQDTQGSPYETASRATQAFNQHFINNRENYLKNGDNIGIAYNPANDNDLSNYRFMP